MKAKIEYNVVPNLSTRLVPLKELANNLCFSWKSEIRELFQRIDPGLWSACRHNPVLMLGLVRQERLDELSQDQGFSRYSGENKPPMLASKYLKPMYITISASKKLGIANPMNPINVKT